MDAPAKVSPGLTLYFRSGPGWFGASISADKGWNHLFLTKAQFNTEDAPTGWGKIDGIRLAAWKTADAATFLAIEDFKAITSDIAIVSGPGKEEAGYADSVNRLIGEIGIESGVVTDSDVANGALDGRKIAIFADNPTMTDSEVAAVERFLAGGGKVMAFYLTSSRLLRDLGVDVVNYKGQEFPGQFSTIKAVPGQLTGLPDVVRQASWNVQEVRAGSNNAKVVAEWWSANGAATHIPALIVSDAGCYMSHVLLEDDPQAKEKMMLALLGGMEPDIWPSAVRRSIAAVGKIGEYETLEQTTHALSLSPRSIVHDGLKTARSALSKAKSDERAGRSIQAIDAAATAQTALLKAYCASQPAKPHEIRAVWCHSAAGVAGQSWDNTLKTLAANGFNTIVPNMMWGGLAYYKSSVLPVDPSVAVQGDRIAQCVSAAKEAGVHVHVWKVNWNLQTAPRDFLAKMRTDRRTQKDPKGGDIDWLCPSNPANFELERDSMLEVVRNYAVDGIHFDYIRYPDSDGCFCDGCRERFEREYSVRVIHWPQDVRTGEYKAKYLQFRRDNITRLVEAVSREARRIRPAIKISAAVFADYPQCRDTVGQDWGLWLKRGYLDFVCPMDYTPAAGHYRQWMASQSTTVAGAVPFVPGIGVTLGSWTLTPDQVVRQVLLGRSHGSSGFILFNLDDYVLKNIVPNLRLGISADR
jgi:uncharacterized lipoprotein YddW (UPF0748 family)